jgi:hypothetical protein
MGDQPRRADAAQFIIIGEPERAIGAGNDATNAGRSPIPGDPVFVRDSTVRVDAIDVVSKSVTPQRTVKTHCQRADPATEVVLSQSARRGVARDAIFVREPYGVIAVESCNGAAPIEDIPARDSCRGGWEAS